MKFLKSDNFLTENRGLVLPKKKNILLTLKLL